MGGDEAPTFRPLSRAASKGRPGSACATSRQSEVQRRQSFESTRPPRPAPTAPKIMYPVMGKPAVFQRASICGRVKTPKIASDEAKLKELFRYCVNANFREVRALAVHYPYLLSMTDRHGFTALHHAEMSGDPKFVSQLLQLYRDPRTFMLKLLAYDNEEDLLDDMDRGFDVVQVTNHPEHGSKAIVRTVGEGTLAADAGIMPGDALEAVSGNTVLSYRQPPPLDDDVLQALRSGRSSSFGFPVTLEFKGSACSEILIRNGWTPSHAAAGYGGPQYRQILQQLLAEQAGAQLAQDEEGYTPEQWLAIQQKTIEQTPRRPLSAGPRPVSAGPRPSSAGRTSSKATPFSRPASAASCRSSGGSAVHDVAPLPPDNAVRHADFNTGAMANGPATARPLGGRLCDMEKPKGTPEEFDIGKLRELVGMPVPARTARP